jgi:hypothetical protein
MMYLANNGLHTDSAVTFRRHAESPRPGAGEAERWAA